MEFDLAALEAKLFSQAAKLTNMAASIESLRVRSQDQAALLRQLEPPSISMAPVYIGDHRILLRTRSGLLLHCDSRDLQVTPSLISQRMWEPALTIVFERLIKPGHHCLEVGAHIGYFATLAGALTGHLGQVDAYEPHPRSYELLCANLRLNKMSHVIRTYPQAVGSTAGTARLMAFDRNAASSTLSSLPDELLSQLGERPAVVEVSQVTLDEQYHQVRDHFDFVKIDAEGAESIILEGGREFFTSAVRHSCVVALEFNPPASQGLGRAPEEALEFLQALGFSLVQLMDDGVLQPLNSPAFNPEWNAEFLARRGTWPASIHQLE